MSDPFSFTLAAPQQASGEGFLGISPDTWANLMRFGSNLSVAANARGPGGFLTYGGGIAGPIGAATQQTMHDNQQLATVRQQQALGQQQLKTAQLQNRLTEMQIPLLGVKLQAAQDFMRDDGVAPATGPAPAPQTGADYPSRVFAYEGSTRNPRSSADGHGQFVNDTWMQFARANPQYFAGMDPQQILAQRGNENLARTATLWLADQNAPILQANGVAPTDGAKGLAHFLGPQVAAAMWKADPNASAAGIIQSVLSPERAQAYLAANPELTRQTAGQVAGRYRAWDAQGLPPPVAAAPPGAAPAVAAPPQVAAAPVAPPDAGGGGGAPPPPAAPDSNAIMAQAQGMLRRAQRGAAAGIDVAPLLRQAMALYETALAGPKAALQAQAQAPYLIQQELAKNGFQINADGGYSIVPGGPADPAYLGRVAGAKAAGELPYRTTEGRPGSVLFQGTQPVGSVPIASEEVLPDGRKARIFRSPLTGAQVGEAVPTELSPEDRAYYAKRGENLAEQRAKIDTDATSAKDTNYLFDNLRNDSRTWDMGKFANIEGQARAYLSALAQTFGIAAPQLNEKLADYQAFDKSSGMLLRQAVHDVSSRAAVQEYNLIRQQLPSPTTSQQGFLRMADQWQALNDYRIAKQMYAQNYTGSPSNFNVDFNSKVSPTAFLLNRMSQTPEGQHDMQTMIARMQETPEGRAAIAKMQKQFEFAKQAGLFGTQ